jgi:carboxyl-terminal processing protease
MQTIPDTNGPFSPVPPNNDPRARLDYGYAQIAVTTLLVVLAFTAGWFGNGFVNRKNYVSNDINQTVMNQAWDEITTNFAVPSQVDKRKMAYAAINAMVATLNDPGHTRFETPEEYNNEAGQLNNQGTVGIGVELSGGGSAPITIVAVFPDTPAANGGLQPGDQIVAVNGSDVRGMTLDQVHPLIVGQENTSVSLTYVRPSVNPSARITVALVRKRFVPPTALSYIIPEANLAYIQLLDFSGNADKELRTQIQAAQKLHVAGIIFDLRGNGGGELDQTYLVASEFIPAGPNKNVVLTETRDGTRTAQPVQSGGLATSTPVVVLVDGDTASAAEITAGAIAIDRPGVHVVGQSTFGTGTVLEPKTLDDGSVLLLATAQWLLPNGQSVYHKGLAPDQPVTLPKNVVPLTALTAPNNQANLAYIQKYNDTQLLQAIKDLQQPVAGAGG